MLYKPKNMYPRLGSDQPIIYLDRLSENETVDFTFNIDGNEKVQKGRVKLEVQQLKGEEITSNLVYDGMIPVKDNNAAAIVKYDPTALSYGFYQEAQFQEEENISLNFEMEFKNNAHVVGSTQYFIGSCYELPSTLIPANGSGTSHKYFYTAGNSSTKLRLKKKDNSEEYARATQNVYLTKIFGIDIANSKEFLIDTDEGVGVMRGRAGGYVSVKEEESNVYNITSTNSQDMIFTVINDTMYSTKNFELPIQMKISIPNASISANETEYTVGTSFTPFLFDGKPTSYTLNKQTMKFVAIYDMSVNTTQKINIIPSETIDGFKDIGIEQLLFAPYVSKLFISGTVDSNQHKITSITIPHTSLFIRSHYKSKTSQVYNTHSWDYSIKIDTINIVGEQTNTYTLPSQFLNFYPTQNTPIQLSYQYKDKKNSTNPNLLANIFNLNIDQVPYKTFKYWIDIMTNTDTLIVSSNPCEALVSLNSPTINFSSEININKFLCQSTFQGTTNETLVNYQWKFYRGTYNKQNDQINGNLIYQTQKIYSQDFQFEYNNLIPGNYVIEAIVEDNYGKIWSKKEPFSVDYEQNGLYLNLQSELDKENTGIKLKWDKPVYMTGEYKGNEYSINNDDINLTKLYGDGRIFYRKPQFKPNQEIYFQTLCEYHKNKQTQICGFNDPPYNGGIDTVFPYYYIQGDQKVSLQNKSGGSYTSYLTGQLDLSNWSTEKDKFLLFSEMKIDSNGKFISLDIYAQPCGDSDSITNNNFKKVYHADTNTFFKWITDELYFDLNNEKLQYMISLSKERFISYCAISIKTLVIKEDDGKYEIPLKLDWNTYKDNVYYLLNIENENNPFALGDPNAITEFIGYNMKRYNPLTQKVSDMGQYYFTQKKDEQGNTISYGDNERRFIDYSLPHNEEVKYLIYPQGSEIITNKEGNKTSQELIFSPVYSNLIKGDWDKWCLFTTRGPAPKNLDGTAGKGYNENVLLVDKVFFFEMNVETGNMKNNTDFSIVKNFTPYPHIQRSPSNYWSGQLKGLLGRLAIDDCTFKQTPTMLQEIKELTQNTSRKFLKDRDGNFWEVELSSDITIDNNDKLDVQLKTKSFNWVEVGDASDVALVSIGPGREDWLLTELGQEQIDISRYTWDENAIWDDNDFWMESE